MPNTPTTQTPDGPPGRAKASGAPVVTDLGQRLRSAREAAGFTMEEAARRIGVMKPTWQAWETGRKEPRSNRLAMTAGVLGVTPSWLLSGMGDGPWQRRATDDPAALLRELRRASDDLAAVNRRVHEIALGLERLG